jgi:hypothetical protein
VTLGRDGKLYPAGHRRPAGANERLAGLVHAMRCGRGMSYRTIQARLAQRETWVSLGSVHHLWHAYECDRCAQPG